MKKLILSLFLFSSLSAVSQMSIRVINLDVKMGEADEVARLFEGYHNVERKSGAAVLQVAHYLDGVTHRIIFCRRPCQLGRKSPKIRCRMGSLCWKTKNSF